jgi:hypothetical protein
MIRRAWNDVRKITVSYISKAAKLKIDPAQWHPDASASEAALSVVVNKAFDAMRPLAIAKARELLKSADPKDNADKIYSAIQEEFFTIAVDGAPILENAAIAGVAQTLAQVTIADAGLISAINTIARDWAKDRAAELVGMKWVNGELVENPNAEWAITDSVRDDIRAIVKNAFEGETPLKDIIADLEEAGPFTNARAKMIARTEVAQAQSAGNYETWKKIEVAQTKWLLSADHDWSKDDPDCEDNDSVTVDLGAAFPSGDLFPPAHPNCQCVLVAVFPDEKS